MNPAEKRLRATARAIEGIVADDSAPPLQLPASVPRRRVLNRASRVGGLRLLAPMAAAAAVIVVVAVLVTLGNDSLPCQNHTSGRCATSGHVPAIGIPPYYIALIGTRQPYPTNPDNAAVFGTRTGTQLASTGPPKGFSGFIDVSSAADDRTFALAAAVGQGSVSGLPAVKFFLARFLPGSSVLKLTPLAMPEIPAGSTFDGFALSPDGSKLAAAFEPNRNAPGRTEELRILNIGTGAVRTWTSSTGSLLGDTANPLALSWSADGRTLAMNWVDVRSHQRFAPSGLRLLDTGAPGADLFARSRLALRYSDLDYNRATAAGYLSTAELAPGGTTIVAAVSAFSGPDAGFAEFSTATGRLERVLGWKPTSGRRSGGPPDVLWASAHGGALVVYAPPGHWNQIGILRGNHLTLLPRPPRAQLPAAAW